MKKHDLPSLLSLIAEPVLLMVLGVILLVWPDAAPMLIAKVIGWCIILIGLGLAVSAFLGSGKPAPKVLWALCCLAVGLLVVRSPLRFAAFVGETIGIFIAITAAIKAYQRKKTDAWGSIALFAVAALLIFMPMTASRLVFSLCGLVILLVGTAILLARLRRTRLDAGNDDPNIIDVDAL